MTKLKKVIIWLQEMYIKCTCTMLSISQDFIGFSGKISKKILNCITICEILIISILPRQLSYEIIKFHKNSFKKNTDYIFFLLLICLFIYLMYVLLTGCYLWITEDDLKKTTLYLDLLVRTIILMIIQIFLATSNLYLMVHGDNLKNQLDDYIEKLKQKNNKNININISKMDAWPLVNNGVKPEKRWPYTLPTPPGKDGKPGKPVPGCVTEHVENHYYSKQEQLDWAKRMQEARLEIYKCNSPILKQVNIDKLDKKINVAEARLLEMTIAKHSHWMLQKGYSRTGEEIAYVFALQKIHKETGRPMHPAHMEHTIIDLDRFLAINKEWAETYKGFFKLQKSMTCLPEGVDLEALNAYLDSVPSNLKTVDENNTPSGDKTDNLTTITEQTKIETEFSENKISNNKQKENIDNASKNLEQTTNKEQCDDSMDID